MSASISTVENIVDKDMNVALYKTMLAVRRVEEKVCEIYPTDKIQSPIHLSIGQEAVATGVCKAMEAQDRMYGTYRGHGLYIARGGDLKRLFAELYGKDAGCARGKGGSMHLIAPSLGLMGCSAIVASTIPIATGHALAMRMQGVKGAAIAFFGDGAVDEGVFFESINFAVLKNLPIVYVCENNNYAVHSRVSDRHKQTDLSRIGEGLGLVGRRLEGNDVRSVYSAMRDALCRTREGGGPILLEFLTYRLREHVGYGADHQESYRDSKKLAAALDNDALAAQQAVLQEEWAVPAEAFRQWETSLTKEIQEAVDFAEQAPFPGPERLQEDLFR